MSKFNGKPVMNIDFLKIGENYFSTYEEKKAFNFGLSKGRREGAKQELQIIKDILENYKCKVSEDRAIVYRYCNKRLKELEE